ncbi:MAG: PotD/PotF family extracellular solute-binding protein [Burkholderiales bacterium]
MDKLELQDAIARLDRREFIKAGSAFGFAMAAGVPVSVLAQQAAIRAVMPNVFIPDPVRPIIAAQTGGIKVDNLPYVSPTDTLAKLMAPGGTTQYDMMVSLTNLVKGPALGAKEGDEKLLPLNLAQVPNAKHVAPQFQGEVITRAGKTYLVPVVWGYESVIYDASKMPADDALTQSWNAIFSDKYKGRIAWRDDAHGMIFTAALAMGKADPLQLDPGDIKEVQKFLIDRKRNIRTMWTKFAEAVNMISSGEVVCMYGWIAMRAALEKQGVKAANNWPKEGLPYWTQSAFIPKDTKQAEGAHKVINAMLSKDFGAKLTEVTEYPSTSAEVAAGYSKEYRSKVGFDIVERGIARKPFDLPQRMDLWVEAWNTVKAA